MSKDGFKPCPKCFSSVDVVVVPRQDEDCLTNYYFVNCKECGEGTSKAYHSMSLLQSIWNEKVTLTAAN